MFGPLTKAGAFENRLPGARSVALSQAVVALPGIEGLFHNQAALSFQQNFAGSLFYESRFGLKELSLMAAGLAWPAGGGVFGSSFTQFGTGAYRENKIGLAYAKRLGNLLAASLQFDWVLETLPENRRPQQAVTFEGGLLIGNPDKLLAGVHLFNPLGVSLETPAGKRRIPAAIRSGVTWFTSKSLLWCAEVQKTSSFPALFKAGLEFSPLKRINFRAGISSPPFAATAGVGFSFGSFTFDLGFSHHGNLGVSPSASLHFIP